MVASIVASHAAGRTLTPSSTSTVELAMLIVLDSLAGGYLLIDVSHMYTERNLVGFARIGQLQFRSMSCADVQDGVILELVIFVLAL